MPPCDITPCQERLLQLLWFWFYDNRLKGTLNVLKASYMQFRTLTLHEQYLLSFNGNVGSVEKFFDLLGDH